MICLLFENGRPIITVVFITNLDFLMVAIIEMFKTFIVIQINISFANCLMAIIYYLFFVILKCIILKKT